MHRWAVPLLLTGCLVGAACASGGNSRDAAGATTPEVTARADDDIRDAGTIRGADTAPPATSADTVADSSHPPDSRVFDPVPIEWERLNDAVDVAILEVPVDYGDLGGPVFELYLARYNARDQDDKIGTLLVNLGGPGFGSTGLAVAAARVFDPRLLDRFDIIGWDPRGTGESDPAIDCIADFDPYVAEIDGTPDDAAERELVIATARRFADACIEHNADIIDHVGTNNTARDLDTIRRALGEDRISYFGFSYGSELGATWATMFPETVRAAVLDGASDPEADSTEASVQQLRGFESTLTTFLAECSADDDCAFHNDGDAEGALDELLAELDADPAPTSRDRPPANRDIALVAISQAMYSQTYWPALEQSLAAAAAGDGSGLLALYDSYFQRSPGGTYGNELEAFQVISCADTADRPTVADADAEAALYTEVAPRLAPEGGLAFFCHFMPPSTEPRADITGAGAGPIVVIGTTGDPATPFDSTVRMSEVLEDGRLVVVEADQHTGYGLNRCVIDVVNDYLIDLEPPQSGTECR